MIIELSWIIIQIQLNGPILEHSYQEKISTNLYHGTSAALW
jgi:hypothetical protein